MNNRIGANVWNRWLAVLAALAFSTLAAAAPKAPAEMPRPDGKEADMSKPVQVFILLGQSNMVGMGKLASLENAVKNEKKYPYLVDDEGKWTVRKDVRNVFIMMGRLQHNDWMCVSNRNRVGAEYGIGHCLGNAIDAPVLVLKSCVGNRSLGWDLLPPGSEPYEYDGKTMPGYRGTPDNPKGNGEKVQGAWYAGKEYDIDVEGAKEILGDIGKYYPGAKKYEVAGFFFWQGDKDRYNAAHASRYELNLVNFIKQLRKEFDAPDAKFVCATLGQTKKGAGGNEGKIIDAQLAVDGKKGKYSEFKGNVATVYANPFCHGGASNGHYNGNAETYMDVGEAMGRAMVELLGTAPKAAGPGPSFAVRPPPPPPREPRPLAPGKAEVLDRTLMKTLVALSEAGTLGPRPFPLSLTRAKVALVSVQADDTLTFQSQDGKTATIALKDLQPVDVANLAVVVTQVKPERPDAWALAAVYLEKLGRTKLADKYFDRAGPESTAKMAVFFGPRDDP